LPELKSQTQAPAAARNQRIRLVLFIEICEHSADPPKNAPPVFGASYVSADSVDLEMNTSSLTMSTLQLSIPASSHSR
jgi:hypothetical protein